MASNISLQEEKQRLLGEFSRAARQAKTVVMLRGILRFSAASIVFFIALLSVDIWLQLEAWFIRWSASLLLLLGSATLIVKWLLPAFRFSPSAVDVARWMEKSSCEPSEGIVAALELSQMDPQDSRYGSPQFRELAFEQCRERQGLAAERIGALIRWSALRRALVSSLLAGSILIAFAAWRPEQVEFSLKRLAQPWSLSQWPKSDQLQIVDLPMAVGHGTLLQLEVIDLQPPLPEDISIQLRRPTDKDSPPTNIPARYIDQRAWVDLPPLQREVQIRAVGGVDQSPPWETIQVLDVPEFRESQFEVLLPEYLRSVKVLSDGAEPMPDGTSGGYFISGQEINVVAGSRVRLRGLLSQSVLSVEPVFQPLRSSVGREDSSAPESTFRGEGNSEVQWATRLDRAGTGFTLESIDGSPAVMSQSVEWTFRFRLDEQVTLDSSSSWRVNVLPDDPPEAMLETSAISSIALRAPLSVSGIATDDWRLQEVTVRALLESNSGPEYHWTVALEQDDRELRIKSEFDVVTAFGSMGVPIKPKDRIKVWIEARDDLGQVGRSQETIWTIETAQRQLELIADRKSSLSNQLREVIELQAAGLDLARQTAVSLDQQPPQQGHVDTLSAIVQLQRRINQQVHDNQDGLKQQIDDSLEILQQNRLNDSELQGELEQMQRLLQTTHSAVFNEVWQDSIRAHALLQESLVQADSTATEQRAIDDLQLSQQRSLAALKELLQETSGRESLMQYRRELVQIAEQLENLSSETSETHFRELQRQSVKNRNEIEGISSRQMNLGVELEQWFLRAQQVLHSESQSSDSVTQLLDRAVQVFAKQQTVVAMKSAARSIQNRSLPQALDLQRQAMSDFRQALESMTPEEAIAGREGIDRLKDSSSSQADLSDPLNLKQFSQNLQEILESQQKLLPEYKELASLWEPGDRVGAASDSVESLMKKQLSIRQRVDSMASSVNLVVFDWSLRVVSSDLGKAMAATRRQRVDPDALQAIEDAISRLVAMRDAAETTVSGEGQQAGSDPQREGQDSQVGESTEEESMALASLTLIRAIQADLKQQTLSLDSIPDQRLRNSRLAELNQRQDELLEHLDLLMEIWESVGGSSEAIPP